MKNRIGVLIFIIFGLLVSSVNVYSMDMGQAVHDAKTAADHEALAKYYDEAAKDMESKLQDHKGH